MFTDVAGSLVACFLGCVVGMFFLALTRWPIASIFVSAAATAFFVRVADGLCKKLEGIRLSRRSKNGRVQAAESR